jgi:hypothetical protein
MKTSITQRGRIALSRIVRRLCCLIGRHQWIYDHPNCNHHRNCKPCGRWQAYTLVDCGRQKLWLKHTPPPKPTFEDYEAARKSLPNSKL